MSGLLSTAITGLRVAQTSLSTTGHNIANANVDGYSRQVVRSETNPASAQGGFVIGSGASVASVERQVDDFLVEQLRRDSSLFNEMDIYQDNIAQLDSLLSDASTGLSGAFESFFASVQNGADDPTSIPSRQLIISESENLADRFNTVYDRLISINEGLNTTLASNVAEVNALIGNIADLNQKVSEALGTGNGEPNDLMDQRDQALRELSKYISFQTYEQSFGEVNVLIASGQNLVVGSQSRTLDVVQSEADPTKLDVVFTDDPARQPIVNGSVGGELGGVFRFRDEVLEDTYNKIGRIAIVLSDTYNQFHQQGLDLNNNFGGNFFADVNDTQIARNRVIGNSANALPNDRVMRVNITNSSDLSLSDYEVTMINDGLFSVTRLSDNTEVVREVLTGSYPQTAEFDGLELVFESGSFQRGDSFTLAPTKTGARDFGSVLVNPEELAFATPVVTDASLSNQGNAQISAGQILGLTDTSGATLPMFATPGQMSPPLVVRFISESTYEVLDNSDPGNPVALSPPITNRVYVPGAENQLFSTDPGETIAFMAGTSIGLPAGSTPVIGGGPLSNGYPAETLSVSRASDVVGAPPTVDTIITSTDASARTIASQLDNISGVSANASTYAELSSTSTLSRTSPLQISLNGQDLIEYEFDSGAGAFVVASSVPDPSTDEAAFNDYIAERINSDSSLQALGIHAVAAVNPATGAEVIRVYSSQGDDLEFSLEADATGPDTLNVSDGTNAAVALDGNGAGTTSAIAVGGTLEVTMADGITLGSTPAVSGLFGDTSATNFAQNTYLGIQASIRGAPAAGDTFELNFNLDAANDNRNALALVQLGSTPTVGNGVSTYSESYASVVEIIGINTASSRISRDAAEKVLQQSEELRNSVSGVNLDEEAADLIRFEQMYSANAQVISVARDLFDRLINSF